MIKVVTDGGQQPVAWIKIKHLEEEVPEILLKTNSLKEGESVKIMCDDVLLAAGTVLAEKRHARYKERAQWFRVAYDPKYPHCNAPNITMNGCKNNFQMECLANGRVMNVKMSDGSVFSSDISPSCVAKNLAEGECLGFQIKTLRPAKRGLSVTAKVSWLYRDVDYVDVGRSVAEYVNNAAYASGFDRDYARLFPDLSDHQYIFPTNSPHGVMRLLSSLDRESIIEYSCDCIHIAPLDPSSEYTSLYGYMQFHSILELFDEFMVDETLRIEIHNPKLAGNLSGLQKSEIESVTFVVGAKNSLERWYPHTEYKLGDKVLVGRKEYECTQDHKSGGYFSRKNWVYSGKERNSSYFRENPEDLRFIVNSVRGLILRKSRNTEIICSLNPARAKDFSVGDQVNVVQTDGTQIACLVAGVFLDCRFMKHRFCLKLQICDVVDEIEYTMPEGTCARTKPLCINVQTTPDHESWSISMPEVHSERKIDLKLNARWKNE